MYTKETVYLAGLYLRLSKEDRMQNNESMSISNQRKLTLRFAKENKLVVVEIYIDDGFSGVNFERPAFKRMIKDLEDGKINCVVVKDLSRLGRNDIDMSKNVEQINKNLGRVIFYVVYTCITVCNFCSAYIYTG